MSQKPHSRIFSVKDDERRAIETFVRDESVVSWSHHVACKAHSSLPEAILKSWLLSACFRQLFPKLYAIYTMEQVALNLRTGLVKGFFPDVPFDCLCLNLGGRAISPMHRDSQNVAWGLCCVGVFGEFDYEKGGQLRLEEPKLVLELRRGDIVFLPSAIVTHGNHPLIKEMDRRWSIAMYTPSSNFRWLSNGGKTVSSMTKDEHHEYVRTGSDRWRSGLQLYPSTRDIPSLDGLIF